ncbi:MAG: RnfABCDGE type electron transport complex subunit D [Calditrichaeota bacterium]|nr:MAG: RnfABCDGE type electron transport complex subunit D [Calditrichota bacterium]MBL1207691.1 RnfABCDGE type electron transport complex subunit D [Calditrichota bacterium]NOG47525.1 RnfABCDGE type electron transport complex subunit D [Calditrichota bacterium]
MKTAPKLLLTSSPFLKQQEDTPAVMRQVIYALIPALIAAIYFFGISALLVIVASVFGAVGTEWVFNISTKKKFNSLKDYTALLTGILLAMTLPPGIPLWMAFLGGVVAIALGKLIFGGTGSNIFNPALVGRAFLQSSFPVAITTWSPYADFNSFMMFRGNTFTIPFVKANTDAVTAATPLAQMKFDGKLTETQNLFFGSSAGSLGETTALLLLLGGVYLTVRNYINWRIPTGIFIAVFLFASGLQLIDAEKFASPMFHLFSGGLMLGAIFMATDPVSSPITHKGCWIFGLGIGFLVVLIRTFGGLPEGVMYAILLMNSVTPLLNSVTQPRIYGAAK